MPRSLRPALAVLAGTVVGLALTEALFAWRDQGAFPHVNLYLADPDLGVRLRPGATERLSAGKNPVTHLRINEQGYRGAPWPAPGNDEVLVLGDSQVFGLGVEADQTFSSALARRLGRTVLNAGVPTYGPPEFLHVAEQVFRQRQPRTIVYVVNIANDLFEASRPNRERHGVWDGWAVRREHAPATLRSFPGRELLYRQSHAVFALRRWLHTPVTAIDPGVPSEGTHRDLVSAAARTEQARLDASLESKRLMDQRTEALGNQQQAVEKAEAQIDKLVAEQVDPSVDANNLEAPAAQNYSVREKIAALFRAGRADPGDIVGQDSRPEGGRTITASVALIQQGVALRAAYEKRLRAKAEKYAALADFVTQAFTERESKRQQLRDLRRAPLPVVQPDSPLQPALQAIKQIADQHGARLLVVVLPMDVQVSPTEWAKYGQPPQDVTATHVLLEDIVRDSEKLGAEGLDVTATLRAAEPGAFLDGDLHLTPKGHEAVAGAIADQLAKKAPAPRAMPQGGLPEGRARVPSQEEWWSKGSVYGCDDESFFTTKNIDSDVLCTGPRFEKSWDRSCVVLRVREWFQIVCSSQIISLRLADLVLVSGGHGEAYTSMFQGEQPEAQLITPLFPGERLEAEVRWNLFRQRILITWPKKALEPTFAMGPIVRGANARRPASPHETAVCACQKAETPKVPTCRLSLFQEDEDCFRTYPSSDCTRLLACLEGRPEHPPSCLPGYGNAGARERCRPLCGPDVPCAPGQGVCTSWQGGDVCL